MILYKYLPLDDKNDKGFDSLKIFTDKTLWYSSPLDFNDPFDCKPIMKVPSLKDMKRENGDLFKQVAVNLGVKGVKKLDSDRRSYIGLKNNVESGKFLRDLTGKVGVTCFSETPKEILMWSHYANNHKGFVVEFEVIPSRYEECLKSISEKELFDCMIYNLLAQPVKYTQERPVLKPYIKGMKEGELVERLLHSKSSIWQYEREHRIVASLMHPPGPYRFNPSLLKRVVVGMCMPDDYLQKLKKAVQFFEQKNQVQVQVLYANESSEHYAVEITGL
ncbi:DUF2971 domain-containing protein [Thiomicrospira microaerophila]|uniref:DUF2971 domain-containing protein n=1 Tax=Thiomicrospira microaerophila TaxID=406020 RepID=UPI0005C9F1A7|nr:DUF2971 domain-containing protein [Thiomicrospira microaerophila]